MFYTICAKNYDIFCPLTLRILHYSYVRFLQQKVYEELTEAFGNSTKPPTYDDLQNLRYLELCIKESLRLYPSVPLISRIASKDITTFTGYKIPKDTIVHVHIYDLHHSADVYPNPEKFDPDRFLPENTAKRHPFAYLPFSGGPRNCIGDYLD